MARCKLCGAPIVWLKTQAGKATPCDAQPVAYWEKPMATKRAYTKDGRLIRAIFDGEPGTQDGMGYIPHWATCPQAGIWKQR